MKKTVKHQGGVEEMMNMKVPFCKLVLNISKGLLLTKKNLLVK